MSASVAIRGLMAIADDAAEWKLDPVEQARAACEGGASLVQLRVKRAVDSTALAWAESIREITRAWRVAFFVNDRFDLALAVGADGVHLGQQDVPPSRLPASARAKLLVGRSTHTLAEARAACDDAPDYIAFGPIFETRTKQVGCAARGLEALSAVVRAVAPRPLVAIGGIDASNAASAIAAGAG
ncbi:MAG TPA: thiamine phosphate synthase, partial [Myxococcota bacterium]|nr:thiamine phosphate synthase [Myxococcota bacterium]